MTASCNDIITWAFGFDAIFSVCLYFQVKVTDISSSPDPTSTKETLAEDSVQKQDATNVIPEETDEPVNEPETLPDDEEEDKEPDVLQEGDIFKLTSQAQRTLTELEQLYADIETVYDLISMATSAIAKDYNHLIMQVLVGLPYLKYI